MHSVSTRRRFNLPGFTRVASGALASLLAATSFAGSLQYTGTYGSANLSHTYADEETHQPYYYTTAGGAISSIEKFDSGLGYLTSLKIEADFDYEFSAYLDAAGIDVTTLGTYTHASAAVTSLMAEIVLSPGNGFGYVGSSVGTGDLVLSVTGNVGDGTDYSDYQSFSGYQTGYSYNLLESFPEIREFVLYSGPDIEYLDLTADVAVPLSADLQLINLLSAEVTFTASMTGGSFSVTYEYSEPGDADGDGTVSFDDLLVLAQNYGSAGDFTEGDFNQDGMIDFDDLLILAQRYGSGSLIDASTESPLVGNAFASDWALARTMVPEPATLVCGVGTIGMLTRRRRVG